MRIQDFIGLILACWERNNGRY